MLNLENIYNILHISLFFKCSSDIDECALGIHTCEPDTQLCRNELGRYTCVNKDGSVTKPVTQETGKFSNLSLKNYKIISLFIVL